MRNGQRRSWWVVIKNNIINLERVPMNTHEQVYIDMSIIVMDINKKYCNVQAYGLWSDSFHND